MDVEFAAPGSPAAAGAVLLGVDGAGVEDPEGGFVAVEAGSGAGYGHGVFGHEDFAGAFEAVFSMIKGKWLVGGGGIVNIGSLNLR